jgi:hypothetical protein
MAEFKPYGEVQTFVHLSMTLEEAKALDALAGYGADGFLKVFYEHMGRAYLQPYAQPDARDRAAQRRGGRCPPGPQGGDFHLSPGRPGEAGRRRGGGGVMLRKIVSAECDRCGEVEQFAEGEVPAYGQMLAPQPNGSDWIGAQGSFDAKQAKDLCPACMTALRSWFKAGQRTGVEDR